MIAAVGYHQSYCHSYHQSDERESSLQQGYQGYETLASQYYGGKESHYPDNRLQHQQSFSQQSYLQQGHHNHPQQQGYIQSGNGKAVVVVAQADKATRQWSTAAGSLQVGHVGYGTRPLPSLPQGAPCASYSWCSDPDADRSYDFFDDEDTPRSDTIGISPPFTPQVR